MHLVYLLLFFIIVNYNILISIYFIYLTSNLNCSYCYRMGVIKLEILVKQKIENGFLISPNVSAQQFAK